MHAHAAGFVEFEDELETVLDAIEPALLGRVASTRVTANMRAFDPVDFYRRHAQRVSYLHFKDIDPRIRRRAIDERIGFYDACAAGLFCNLGQGIV